MPRATFAALHRAIDSGLVRACHDLSEGGLAVAAAEMAFAGGLGARIFLEQVPHNLDVAAMADSPERLNAILLFAESNTRFLCEVPQDAVGHFESTLGDVPHAAIGEVIAERKLQIVNYDPANPFHVIDADIGGLKGDLARTAALVGPIAGWDLWRRQHAKQKRSAWQARPAADTRSVPTSPAPRLQPHASPRVLILRAPGTNCDDETAHAFSLAGGQADMLHVNRLLEKPSLYAEFQILCIPGGFSFGDDIASGRILANQIQASSGRRPATNSKRRAS